MKANTSLGYAAKAQRGWQDADLPSRAGGASPDGRARPGIIAMLQSGEPAFQRRNPATQNFLLLPRLGRHRPGRLDLLAADQVHPGEQALGLVAEPRFDLAAYAGQRACRAGRHSREIVEESVLALHRWKLRTGGTCCRGEGAGPQSAASPFARAAPAAAWRAVSFWIAPPAPPAQTGPLPPPP